MSRVIHPLLPTKERSASFTNLPSGYRTPMLIDDEGENRGEGEEGRTPEEQDRGARGDEGQDKAESGPHQPSDGRGHTRAGSNIPNAGKDPTQDRRE